MRPLTESITYVIFSKSANILFPSHFDFSAISLLWFLICYLIDAIGICKVAFLKTQLKLKIRDVNLYVKYIAVDRYYR